MVIVPDGINKSSKCHFPLRWPEYWKRPNRVDAFFRNVPIVGLNYRVFDEISMQLKDRTPKQFEHAWTNDTEIWKYRDWVSKVICDYLAWPCSLFFPTDPCEILFWTPNDDLLSAEALLVISEEYYLPSNFWDDFPNFTYKVLLEQIRSVSKVECPDCCI